MAGYILLVETLTHMVPVMRDKLDTKDPQFLGGKLLLVGVSLGVYLLSLWATCRRGTALLEQTDF